MLGVQKIAPMGCHACVGGGVGREPFGSGLRIFCRVRMIFLVGCSAQGISIGDPAVGVELQGLVQRVSSLLKALGFRTSVWAAGVPGGSWDVATTYDLDYNPTLVRLQAQIIMSSY